MAVPTCYSSFMEGVMQMLIRSDSTDTPVKRKTRNVAPTYTSPTLEELENGGLDQTDEETNGDGPSKRAKTALPRNLTAKRKEIINSFLHQESVLPGRFGEICDDRWIKELAKRFETPSNVGGWSEDPERIAVVKEWLDSPDFSEKIEKIREKQGKHEEMDVEPSSQLSGPHTPVIPRVGPSLSEAEQVPQEPLCTEEPMEVATGSNSWTTEDVSSLVDVMMQRFSADVQITNDANSSGPGTGGVLDETMKKMAKLSKLVDVVEQLNLFEEKIKSQN